MKTPDDTIISLTYVNHKAAKELLSSNNYTVLPEDKLDFFKRNAYLLKDGKVLYEIEVNKYYLLVDDMSNYLRMLKGNNYYESGIFINPQSQEIYSSFNLLSRNAKNFYDKKVKLLDKYPVFDGYHTYLMPDSSIAYLRERVYGGKSFGIYDGYWYPSIKDFEYYYYFLTTDKYAPDPEL
ncbi:MAG: hypothetical protein JST21_05130 [Bacteroidetes bacterium]|nr:hypothetical protein [Bacteroidota bacterium]